MSRVSMAKKRQQRLEEQLAAELASDPKVLRDVAEAFEAINNGNTIPLEEAFAPRVPTKKGIKCGS